MKSGDNGSKAELEALLVQMTYVQAFLHLTVELEMPFVAAIDYLHFLASKHPTSRLGVHTHVMVPGDER